MHRKFNFGLGRKYPIKILEKSMEKNVQECTFDSRGFTTRQQFWTNLPCPMQPFFAVEVTLIGINMSQMGQAQAEKEGLIPSFNFGFSAKIVCEESPYDTQGFEDSKEYKTAREIGNILINDTMHDNDLGNYPFSLGINGSGIITVQSSWGVRSKRYYSTDETLGEGDTVTILCDRIKGNFYFFKNGDLLRIQRVGNPTEYAKIKHVQKKQSVYNTEAAAKAKKMQKDIAVQQKVMQAGKRFSGNLVEGWKQRREEREAKARADEEAEMERLILEQLAKAEEDEKKKLNDYEKMLQEQAEEEARRLEKEKNRKSERKYNPKKDWAKPIMLKDEHGNVVEEYTPGLGTREVL